MEFAKVFREMITDVLLFVQWESTFLEHFTVLCVDSSIGSWHMLA